jgi:hypothetical protein
MYTLISTTVRPDISYDFWWYSGLQPAGFFDSDSSHFISGDIITSYYDISLDGLTLTRTITFRDQLSAIKTFSEKETSYPTIFDEKNAYNALHGHVETKVYTTV